VYLPSPPLHLFSCPRVTRRTSGGSCSSREGPDDDDDDDDINNGSLFASFLSFFSSLYLSTVLSLPTNPPVPPHLSLPKQDTISSSSSTMTNSDMPIPSTPHVTSPSPAPSSVSSSKPNGSYFPTSSKSIHTASLSEVTAASRPAPIERSRTRDRMTAEELRRRRTGAVDNSEDDASQKSSTKRGQQQMNGAQEAEGNGYLSPTSAAQTAGRYLRDFSRSSSPLGLIPIHRDWRYFVSPSFPHHHSQLTSHCSHRYTNTRSLANSSTSPSVSSPSTCTPSPTDARTSTPPSCSS